MTAGVAGFGDPVQDEAAVDAHNMNGSGDGAAQADLDPNDPRLTSEAITDNQEADAYAVPPPLPDGKWRAKLKAIDIDDSGKKVPWMARLAGWMNPPRPMLVTNVEASVINLEAFEGRFDGTKLTDYWIKTLIDRSGTSQASTIVRKSGGTLPASTTDRQRMDALLKQLAKEPEVLVETAWAASCETCQKKAEAAHEKKPKDFLVGMHRFKQLRDGTYDPAAQCPVCHTVSRARPRIVRYLSVQEAQATHR